MAIQLRSTKDVHADGYKFCVYGATGSGKTNLIKTFPDLDGVIVLSAESGLLTLSDMSINYIEINTLADMIEAYEWLADSEDAKHFHTVCLDSISEIAEIALSNEKKLAKDPRQAYGELLTNMTDLIRRFRDLKGKNVYFSAKSEQIKDESGRLLYSPSMPGAKLSQSIPFLFDFVFPLVVGKDEAGVTQRALMTEPDGVYTAKGRTTNNNRLEVYEPADMSVIIKKLGGQNV